MAARASFLANDLRNLSPPLLVVCAPSTRPHATAGAALHLSTTPAAARADRRPGARRFLLRPRPRSRAREPACRRTDGRPRSQTRSQDRAGLIALFGGLAAAGARLRRR